jgi:hypothetical protein
VRRFAEEIPSIPRLLRADRSASLFLAVPLAVLVVCAIAVPLVLLWFSIARPQEFAAFSWLRLTQRFLTDHLALVLFLFALAVLPVMALRRARLLRRFLREGQEVHGRVTSVQHHAPWMVEIEYSHDGVDCRRSIPLRGPRQAALYTVGEEVTLIVQPDNPGRCELTKHLVRGPNGGRFHG